MRESTKHREAFATYVDLGSERSIERLQTVLKANGHTRGLRTLYEWSRQFHWQHRIDDLEHKARLAEDEARITAIREMRERQAKEALALQQKGMEWLQALGDKEPAAEAAIRAVVEGAKLERLARGEVTERTETIQSGGGRLEELEEEELESLIKLAEKTVGGEDETGSD